MVAYSFKRRFVNPIRVGLGAKPLLDLHGRPMEDAGAEIRPKRQTIRAFGKPRNRHARAGETLQLFHAMRTKSCYGVGVAICESFEGILLKWSEWRSFCTFDVAQQEPGVWRRVGDVREIGDPDEFARADGFTDLDDMARFWSDEHGAATFEGGLVKWRPVGDQLMESADD